MISANSEIPLEFLSQLVAQESLLPGCYLYGLYDASKNQPDTLGRAQCDLLDFLKSQLLKNSAPGDRLLLLGKSLVSVAESLQSQGRLVSIVLSDTSGEKKSELTLIDNFFDLTYENYYDLILIEGSILYLDQLALFNQSRKLIADNGKLVIISEFINDDSRIEKSPLANVSSFKQLSSRLGFSLSHELDLSDSARQSLAILAGLLKRNGQAYNSVDENQLMAPAEVKQVVGLMLNEFESYRRCYRLFELQYAADAEDEYATAQYSANGSFEPAEIASLFEASFDAPLDMDLWHWKYVLGDGKSVVAKLENSEEIVSHYGGAPRDIYYFGKQSKAIQVGDVMVLPSIRRSYGKNSLFFKTAATFLEREIGNTVNHLLGFGFPNQKAMNIAIRLGLYEKTDDFIELQMSLSGSHPHEAASLTALDSTSQQHRDLTERLWAEMRDECGDYIVGVRDWNYFDYRYLQHPAAGRGEYRCLILHSSQQAEGSAVVVLKQHGEHELLVDIIAAPSKLNDNLHALNGVLLNSEPAKPLKFWITKAWVDRLALSGVVEHKLGIEIPCNSWNPGPSAETLYGAWWLTAGDMDFM